ncbi:MAG: SusD/RagB family nutrient-binding outer membrane lipoprotein, partial [Bryocella sp.]
MKRYARAAFLVAIPTLLVSGCNENNYLKCSSCITSPTSPTTASSQQLLVAAQANLWQRLNGNLARIVSMWMQQMAGTAVQYRVIDSYVIDAGTAGGDLTLAYTGGGLIDLRKIESQSAASSDNLTVGIAQVIEAWQTGTSADIWGDVPYSQAAKPDSFPHPTYDKQQDVYTAVLSLLDQAVTNLGAGGSGPGVSDLVYKGDPQKWTALAHTLKARFYLHLVERDPTNYAKALAEANLGIASNAGDYVTQQTATANQQNDWFQFILNSNRNGLMAAGKFGVDLLANSNDPRLTEYYQPAAGTSTIQGAAPAQPLASFMGQISAKRLAPDFGQPLVTYNENLLIKAEALFQIGNAQAALDTLNKERAAWALTGVSWHSSLTLAPVAAPATLAKIMDEKYVVLFQNIEAWNDYKRTCLPALTPSSGKSE